MAEANIEPEEKIEDSKQSQLPEWLRSPEMLVGLSAVLLSICGLFISFYEASLIRQSQRASTWPYVEVAAAIRNDDVTVWVRNTGVGPARIQTGAVTYKGELQESWGDLMRSVFGERADSLGIYSSFINGSVLPPNSNRQTIFSLNIENRGVDREAIVQFSRAILNGELDVVICYSSVYDECWTSSIQDVYARLRGNMAPGDSREVTDCESTPRSRI